MVFKIEDDAWVRVWQCSRFGCKKWETQQKGRWEDANKIFDGFGGF